MRLSGPLRLSANARSDPEGTGRRLAKVPALLDAVPARSQPEQPLEQHKFRIGQLVSFSPGKSALAASTRDYKIVRLMPPENGTPCYRIKSVSEPFERVASENELTHR